MTEECNRGGGGKGPSEGGTTCFHSEEGADGHENDGLTKPIPFWNISGREEEVSAEGLSCGYTQFNLLCLLASIRLSTQDVDPNHDHQIGFK